MEELALDRSSGLSADLTTKPPGPYLESQSQLVAALRLESVSLPSFQVSHYSALLTGRPRGQVALTPRPFPPLALLRSAWEK